MLIQMIQAGEQSGTLDKMLEKVTLYFKSRFNQIIDNIRPEGTIALMGVSESLIEINTRMVLERGLTMIGSSRSGVEDFQQTVDFLEKHQGARNRL